MPSNGLWSVATISSLLPTRTNILAFSEDYMTANVSSSVGEYQLYVGVVNLEPEHNCNISGTINI